MTEQLAEKKCVPCHRGGDPLAADTAEDLRSHVPKWDLIQDGCKIERRFRFDDFKQAWAFCNQVAELAEDANHHPDFHVSWNKVTLTLFTHAIGGLHQNDFIMAARIDRLLE